MYLTSLKIIHWKYFRAISWLELCNENSSIQKLEAAIELILLYKPWSFICENGGQHLWKNVDDGCKADQWSQNLSLVHLIRVICF